MCGGGTSVCVGGGHSSGNASGYAVVVALRLLLLPPTGPWAHEIWQALVVVIARRVGSV